MSLFEKHHTNPGTVIMRLEEINMVRNSGRDVQLVHQRLDQVFQNIQKQTPVKTGYLKSTEKLNSNQDMAQISVTARYANYVNKGTRGRTANPFFSRNIEGLSVELAVALRNLYGANR